MGCFSETCAISGLPVDSGDITIIIPMAATGTPPSSIGQRTPVSSWIPATLPIIGEYDDYGFIEHIDKKLIGPRFCSLIHDVSVGDAISLLGERDAPLPGNEDAYQLAYIRADVWNSILGLPFTIGPDNRTIAQRSDASRPEMVSWTSACIDAVSCATTDDNDELLKRIIESSRAHIGSPGVFARAMSDEPFPIVSDATKEGLASLFRNAMLESSKETVNDFVEAALAISSMSMVIETIGAVGKSLIPGSAGPQSGATAAHWLFESAMADLAKGDLESEMAEAPQIPDARQFPSIGSQELASLIQKSSEEEDVLAEPQPDNQHRPSGAI